MKIVISLLVLFVLGFSSLFADDNIEFENRIVEDGANNNSSPLLYVENSNRMYFLVNEAFESFQSVEDEIYYSLDALYPYVNKDFLNQKLIYAQQKLGRANRRSLININYLKEIFSKSKPFKNYQEYEEYKVKISRLFSNFSVTYAYAMRDIRIIKRYVPRENRVIFENWIKNTNELIHNKVQYYALIFLHYSRLFDYYNYSNVNDNIYFTEYFKYLLEINANAYPDFDFYSNRVFDSIKDLNNTRNQYFQRKIDVLKDLNSKNTVEVLDKFDEMISKLDRETTPTFEEYKILQKEIYIDAMTIVNIIRAKMFYDLKKLRKYVNNDQKVIFDRLIETLKYMPNGINNTLLLTHTMNFITLDYDTFVLEFENKKDVFQ